MDNSASDRENKLNQELKELGVAGLDLRYWGKDDPNQATLSSWLTVDIARDDHAYKRCTQKDYDKLLNWMQENKVKNIVLGGYMHPLSSLNSRFDIVNFLNSAKAIDGLGVQIGTPDYISDHHTISYIFESLDTLPNLSFFAPWNITMREDELSIIPQKFPNLKGLRLTASGFGTDMTEAGFNTFSTMKNLESLELTHYKIPSGCTKRLAGLPLKKFHLSAFCDRENFEGLAALTTLEDLELHVKDLPNLDKMTNLKSLKLEVNNTVKNLEHVATAPNLENLAIEVYAIEVYERYGARHISEDVLTDIATMGKLKTLSLVAHGGFRDPVIRKEDLAIINRMPLESLAIATDLSASAKAAEPLLTISSLKNLKLVSYYANDFDFNSLENLKELEVLDIGYVDNISTQQLEQLSKLITAGTWPNLKRIEIEKDCKEENPELANEIEGAVANISSNRTIEIETTQSLGSDNLTPGRSAAGGNG
jgi:hypothetical protein